MANSVLWLFLRMPWIGLPCVIVTYPGKIHVISDKHGIQPRLIFKYQRDETWCPTCADPESLIRGVHFFFPFI